MQHATCKTPMLTLLLSSAVLIGCDRQPTTAPTVDEPLLAASTTSGCTYDRVTPSSAQVSAEGTPRLRIDASIARSGPRSCPPLRVHVSPAVTWLTPLSGVDCLSGQGPRGFSIEENTTVVARAATIEFFTADARGTRSIAGRTRVEQAARAFEPLSVSYTTFDGTSLRHWAILAS
jgi:hypothetical protein